MRIIKLKELINDEYDDGFWDNKIVELKKWNLDDILTLNIIEGATPAYRLVDAGFTTEERIDVKILFVSLLNMTTSHYVQTSCQNGTGCRQLISHLTSNIG